MRRNQYSSEKRRKELDRKKKQEEKRQKKLERKNLPADGTEGTEGAVPATDDGQIPAVETENPQETTQGAQEDKRPLE